MGRSRRGDRTKADHFSRRAKAEGYAARSVFKLEEIDQRFKVFRPGDTVLDLGCSPGSWMQFAAKKVGPKGAVLGFDLKATEGSLPHWADARMGDVYELENLEEGPFSVVMSDMAPATTGQRDTDAARSMALAEHALDLAETHLKTGGHFIAKLLEGRDVPDFAQLLRQRFTKLERLRPSATRRSSTELFVIGLGYKGKAELDTQGATA